MRTPPRFEEYGIAAVVPAFRVEAEIEQVICSLPAFLRHIIVVDDASPDATGSKVSALAERDSRILLLTHERNQGVGGAVATGFRKALELGAQIVVKIDGDGQMDPQYMPALLSPLVNGKADYAKGNRFRDFEALRQMPFGRRIANMALSFTSKAASGYWNCFDPANGYFAVRSEVLAQLPLERVDRRYFFETWMLANLYLQGAYVVDVPMPARYGNERSSLSMQHAALEFPLKLLATLAAAAVAEVFPLRLFHDVHLFDHRRPFDPLRPDLRHRQVDQVCRVGDPRAHRYRHPSHPGIDPWDPVPALGHRDRYELCAPPAVDGGAGVAAGGKITGAALPYPPFVISVAQSILFLWMPCPICQEPARPTPACWRASSRRWRRGLLPPGWRGASPREAGSWTPSVPRRAWCWRLARAGYRVLVTAYNPIVRFLIEMAASAPAEADLTAALAELGASRKSDERLETRLQSLYLTTCEKCGKPVQARAFLWNKDADTPYAARL